MNLSQLYYFKKLAELQHYTKAAQELCITQPSLSGAIHSLEDELGVSLFQKKGRNVVLTKSGREFYTYVSSALSELDKGTAIMQERASKLKGKIEVGCINPIMSDFLPGVINEFHNRGNAFVQFKVHTGQTELILENVRSGKWDVGFCSYAEGHPAIEFVPVLTQSLVAAVTKDSALADRSSLTLDDLAELNSISYHSEMPIGSEIMDLLGPRQVHTEFNYSTEEAMIGSLRIGKDIAILLRTQFVVNTPDILLLKITDVPEDFHTIQMAYNRDLKRLHAADSFIEFVTANYRYDRTR